MIVIVIKIYQNSCRQKEMLELKRKEFKNTSKPKVIWKENSHLNLTLEVKNNKEEFGQRQGILGVDITKKAILKIHPLKRDKNKDLYE